MLPLFSHKTPCPGDSHQLLPFFATIQTAFNLPASIIQSAISHSSRSKALLKAIHVTACLLLAYKAYDTAISFCQLGCCCKHRKGSSGEEKKSGSNSCHTELKIQQQSLLVGGWGGACQRNQQRCWTIQQETTFEADRQMCDSPAQRG